ncbi:hypothetical protein LCGC14_1499420 [marine sediment metagenome]|uniref:Uncharacterized protein n=1 Tax=marine sediment metagenome TaxID=412755 RepID=A0A0F9J4F1_9ZZZZ|nr:hypothetical protein [Candidatus Scalindua sp.]
MISTKELEAIAYDHNLLPGLIVDQLWDAVEGVNTPTYIYVGETIKRDQLGLQLEYTGTYHDCNDYELFNFHLESGINQGSLIIEITPPDQEVIPSPIVHTIYRFWVKDESSLLALKKLKASWDTMEDLGRKMSYDKTFSPTGKIDDHYKDVACNLHAEVIQFTGTPEEIFDWEKKLPQRLDRLISKLQEEGGGR